MLNVRTFDLPAADFEKITVSDEAIGLTAGKLAGKKAAFITVETASIRFRIDGTAPDTDTGHIVVSGGNMFFNDRTGAALTNLSMIRDGAADATVQVTYY